MYKDNFKKNNNYSNDKPKFSRDKNFSKPNHNSILLKRYDKFFGEGSSRKLLDSIRYSKDEFIRVNDYQNSIEEVEKFLNRNRIRYKNTMFDNCLRIERSHFSLASSLYSLTGKIYIQDIASQVPVNCIDVELLKKLDKVRILDCCAAPGSKTTQIADLMKSNGINYEIIALEPEIKRHTKIINNIQKQGFQNIEIVNCKAQNYKSKTKFDIVMVDAPCSGNLIFDRDWLNKRDLEGIESKAQEQKDILENVSKLVSKEGILIYSTCSIEPEENEDNVQWFEKNFEFKSVLPKLKFDYDTTPITKQNSIRFLPYKTKTQGFFVCIFKRKN
jgi:16S rRNA C967 or C1407 C5-methylase (RsmB/RsmF family)